MSTEDEVVWLKRSRHDRWSKIEPTTRAEAAETARRALLKAGGQALNDLEQAIRLACLERAIVHDSPYLSIFRTTKERALQLAASAQGADAHEREERYLARARGEDVYRETRKERDQRGDLVVGHGGKFSHNDSRRGCRTECAVRTGASTRRQRR